MIIGKGKPKILGGKPCYYATSSTANRLGEERLILYVYAGDAIQPWCMYLSVHDRSEMVATHALHSTHFTFKKLYSFYLFLQASKCDRVGRRGSVGIVVGLGSGQPRHRTSIPSKICYLYRISSSTGWLSCLVLGRSSFQISTCETDCSKLCVCVCVCAWFSLTPSRKETRINIEYGWVEE